MGKKRTRAPGAPRSAISVSEGGAGPVHTQSLAEQVRELHDAEYAAERRQTERAKRQKISAEAQLSVVKRAEKSAKRKADKARSVSVRMAALKQLKAAQERRKQLSQSLGGKTEQHNDEENVPLDDRTTARILQQAQQQQLDIEKEDIEMDKDATALKTASLLQGVGQDAQERDIALAHDSDDDREDCESEGSEAEDVRTVENSGEQDVSGDEDQKMHEDADVSFLDATDISKADELALSMFENGGVKNNDDGESPPKLMLADIIMNKLREKEAEDARKAAAAADPERAAREKKIADVYALVGNILSRYRSGKVPKAFKVIPKLSNWEELMYMTRPDNWSPAAMFMATRIFSSNLTAKQAESFYRDILLPRCLDDISENKKLNYHLYQALQRAACKPDAFNKGVLFSLCEPGASTLRQATVFSSVLAKVSMPMLHSAAAIMYISQLPWSPATCMFMSSLLDKRYALPYKVVDSVVEYFVRMKSDSRVLPLLWHKCLLIFAQRYKMELELEQKEELKFLMRVHTHAKVTPEIRRELFSSRNRGDKVDPDVNMIPIAIANAV